MRRFCKPYHLRELKQFAGWQTEVIGESADDAIVYLWDDYTVTASPVLRDLILFAPKTESWKAFCAQTLRFAIPDDLSEAPQSVSPSQDSTH